MLALAWGKRQRQEAKIHRPDLCYVAQGFPVKSLANKQFDGLLPDGKPVSGKHMVVMTAKGGEAVSYWMRIGTLYSENAFESRMQIFKEGLKGRVTDGILVRASQRIRTETDAQAAFPVLDQFLFDLVNASPENVRAMLVRG
jgi:EpsI family protein